MSATTSSVSGSAEATGAGTPAQGQTSSTSAESAQVRNEVTATLDKLPNGVPAEASQASSEAAGKGAEGGSAGLPQLDTGLWPGQMVWLILIFGVFLLFMAKFAAPRLRGVISKRGATIAEDLANARAIRDEAEAQADKARADMVAAHNLARKTAAESKARIQSEMDAEKAHEDEKLGVVLARAEAEIRVARDKAMSHVEDIAVETAQALYARLTGKPATKTALIALLKKN